MPSPSVLRSCRRPHPHWACVRLSVVVALLVAAFSTVVLGGTGLADGIGISPAIITYPDTMRGVTYTGNLTLSNTSDTTANEFQITPIGDVADWIELEQRDDGTDGSTVIVEPESSVQVAVLLTVPPTAANGSYTGALDIISSEVDVDLDEGSGATVQIGGLVDIAVDVVGDERRAARVGDMYVEPAEVGMPQRFNAVVENLGNVRVEPVLEVEILREGEVVAQLTSRGSMNPVFPGSSATTFVDWDTSEETVGPYEATFRVVDTAGGEPIEIGSAVVDFRLEQLGTFTRQGTFDALVVLGQPQVGTLTNVEATFTNAGKITSNAIASVDIYRDGELVDTAVSLERSTRPGETAKIVLPIATDEYGDYRLVGTVNYEGLVTEPREVTFRIAAPVQERSDRDWVLIGGVAAGGAALVAAGLAVVGRRRRTLPVHDEQRQSVGAGRDRR